MGQAKRRGTREERVAASLQRQAAERPPAMACNACQAVLADVSAFDTQALRGIAAAFYARCAACEQDTWAVRGETAAVRAFYDALEKAAGHKVQMGTAKPTTTG